MLEVDSDGDFDDNGGGEGDESSRFLSPFKSLIVESASLASSSSSSFLLFFDCSPFITFKE